MQFCMTLMAFAAIACPLAAAEPVPPVPVQPAPAPDKPAATAPTSAPATTTPVNAATKPAPSTAPATQATQPAPATEPAPPAVTMNVRDVGAKGDGVSDDTAAFQTAMDATAKAGGGVVSVPAGDYLIKTQLSVPSTVTLEGVARAPGAKVQGGSRLLAVAGAGSEKEPGFITLGADATVKGLVISYPNQKPDAIVPYPWCITAAGENVAIIDCVLVNPFQGIDLATHPSARHLVRNVQGQPLRRGLMVDKCYDAGRIENVHFGPIWNWEEKTGIQAWMGQNGEAFIFARADSQALSNTFCYGYKVGYRFIASADGAAGGSFTGMGADATGVAVLIEASQGGGLLISNGQFVSFIGDKPTQVVTFESFAGNVQFQNCAFWGASQQVARLAGPGTVSFNNCNFANWANGFPAIDLSGGNLLVIGSTFQKALPQLTLQNKAQSAVFVGNRLAGPLSIANPAGVVLQAGLNAEPKPADPKP